MKIRSEYAMQFSGYPLTVVEEKIEARTSPVIRLAPKDHFNLTKFIQSNAVTHDPKYWDHEWFASYE